MTFGSRNTAKSGFTLIELLVVIAIIAILAAILFPVFAAAKAAAKKASCLSNTKQVSIAVMMYAGDNDDTIFPMQYGYSVGSDGYMKMWFGELHYNTNTWDFNNGMIGPYMKSGQITDCPSAESLPSGSSWLPVAYAVNSMLYFDKGPKVANYSEVESTSETIFMGDAAALYGPTPMRYNVLWVPSGQVHLQARHGGEVTNIAWLDGHAKSMKLYYHTTNIYNTDYKVLKEYKLGDLLKYSKEDPSSGTMTDRDCYYYMLKKPS